MPKMGPFAHSMSPTLPTTTCNATTPLFCPSESSDRHDCNLHAVSQALPAKFHFGVFAAATRLAESNPKFFSWNTLFHLVFHNEARSFSFNTICTRVWMLVPLPTAANCFWTFAAGHQEDPRAVRSARPAAAGFHVVAAGDLVRSNKGHLGVLGALFEACLTKRASAPPPPVLSTTWHEYSMGSTPPTPRVKAAGEICPYGGGGALFTYVS